MPNLPRFAMAGGGPIKMSGVRDEDGHRTWTATWRIRVAEDTDKPPFAFGPATALQCPGLPLFGSRWIIQGDLDVWAWCRSNNTIEPSPGWQEGTPCRFYDVSFTFSTKPPSPDRGGRQNYQRPDKQDPLAEQDKISGSFVKYTEEVGIDRFGIPIMSTSWEPFRGPQVEFDKNRAQIRIEQNVLDLQLSLLNQMTDTVNDRPMWGFPKRCIKLGVPNWARQFHSTGVIYYTRTLEFEIYTRLDEHTGATVSGFDRNLVDHGNFAINGAWDTATNTWKVRPLPGNITPDPGNPSHYTQYLDRAGNKAKCVFDNSFSGKPMLETLGGLIASITATGGVQVTTTVNHNLVDGDIVVLRYLTGNDAVNIQDKQWTVNNTQANTAQFNLQGATASDLNVQTNNDNTSIARWYKVSSKANRIQVQYYEESNFFRLGLPTALTTGG